jgi:hypothetical protein
VTTRRLLIDRDELLTEFFDSGNRIDRKKKLLNLRVRGSALLSPTAATDRGVLTPTRGYKSVRGPRAIDRME